MNLESKIHQAQKEELFKIGETLKLEPETVTELVEIKQALDFLELMVANLEKLDDGTDKIQRTFEVALEMQSSILDINNKITKKMQAIIYQ
jgi:hypothetical protein